MFLTFEGTECSGKTTIILFLKEYLELKGYNVLVTREPGGNPISEDIRAILLDPANKVMHPYTEMLLYASSRVEHFYNQILPALNDGYIVLCDRFLDSSLAYQSYGRGIPFDLVLSYNSLVLKHLPNKTFFFNIEPKTAFERFQSRGELDRIEQESLAFHERVYNGYLELAELYSDRFEVIDGTMSLDEIKLAVLTTVEKLLND